MYAAPSPARRFIKNVARKTVLSLGVLMSPALAASAKRSAPGVRILTYHAIDDTPENPFSVSPAQFAAQMALLKASFRVIALSEAVAYLQGQAELTQNAVVITFDDGLLDNYQHAYPVLREFNLPATMFLVPNFIESSNARFITWQQAREMGSHLIEFGSHTSSHHSLTTIPLSQARAELVESRQTIEQRLGQPVRHFSYPFGTFRDFNDNVKTLVQETGYHCACASVNGTNAPGCDLFALRRTKIEHQDTIKGFHHIVRGKLDSWYIVDRAGYALQGKNRQRT
jgi:peptidoglycan/xylan/chitin deacetylase (PgdA/CDA1 family)